MYVTYSDLFAFVMVLIAVAAFLTATITGIKNSVPALVK